MTPIVVNQQYAELAELAGGFIHEIKNHLSTLGLNLQLLAEDFQDPQTQRERRALDRIQRLQNECQRLVDVSNDFLRFARVKDLELIPTNLGEVVEEMIDFFGPTARPANIEIKSYLPADLPPVALDRDLFKQALLNLLLNAQQAMPAGGEITLQARAEPDGVVLEPDRHRHGHDAGSAGQGVSALLLDAQPAAPASACRRRARSSRRTAAPSTCKARSAAAPSSPSACPPWQERNKPPRRQGRQEKTERKRVE